MDVNQLVNVREVALRQSVTMAARDFGMTQPAMSRVVSGLEQELGVQIFDREGKKLTLNPYGEIVLRHSDNILDLIADAKLSVQDQCGRGPRELKLCSAFSPGEPNRLLKLLIDYGDMQGGLKITCDVKSLRKCQLDLMIGDMDLAFAPPDIQNEKIAWKHLLTERLGVIMSRNHPLAGKEKLSIHDLRGQRIAVRNGNSAERELLRSICSGSGIEPETHYVADYPEFIMRQLRTGRVLAVSFLPYRGVREEGLTEKPFLEEYCCMEAGIGYLRNRYISKIKGGFMDFIVERTAAMA